MSAHSNSEDKAIHWHPQQRFKSGGRFGTPNLAANQSSSKFRTFNDNILKNSKLKKSISGINKPCFTILVHCSLSLFRFIDHINNMPEMMLEYMLLANSSKTQMKWSLLSLDVPPREDTTQHEVSSFVPTAITQLFTKKSDFFHF